MLSLPWLNSLAPHRTNRSRRKSRRHHGHRNRVRRPFGRRATIEALEARTLLAVTVVNVDTFEDVVDPDDGVTSLREAIIEANSNPGDYEIRLPAGEYFLTIPGADEDDGFTGDLDIHPNGSVTIIGVGEGQTIVNAGGLENADETQESIPALGDRVFHVHSGAVLAIEALTIAGGTAPGGYSSGRGGGVYVEGQLYFDDGVYVAEATSLYVNQVTLVDNHAAHGGGVYGIHGQVAIVDSTFVGNSAVWGGGGVYNSGIGQVSLVGSTLVENEASRGGGLVNSGATLMITDSLISGNQAASDGGGIEDWFGTTFVASSTISGNRSGESGGGLVSFNGDLTISSSTISGNSAAANGGGLANFSTLTITNSTISGNQANGYGGGVFSDSGTVTHSTITGNRADANGDGNGFGGGMGVLGGVGSSSRLFHTIVAGNVVGSHAAGTANDIANLNLDPQSAFNLIADPDSAGGLIHGRSGNIVGQDDHQGGRKLIDVTNILDLELADNGGPTRTHALVPGSRAIDAGDPDFDPETLDPPLSWDQRGLPRVFNERVDIGAVELAFGGDLAAGGDLDLNNEIWAEISQVGEIHEWTFLGESGQSVTLVVHPGFGGAYLNHVDIQILSPDETMLADIISTVPGAPVTLPDVVLPDDGTYRVVAKALDVDATGIYAIALWDARTKTFDLPLGQENAGTLDLPFHVDRWMFSATQHDQVRLQILDRSSPSIHFRLLGPEGWVGLDGVTSSSGLISLPADGLYALEVYATSRGHGDYKFELSETSQIVLELDSPLSGTVSIQDQPQLFIVELTDATPLLVEFHSESQSGQVDLFAKHDAPPTVTDFRFSNTQGELKDRLGVPLAEPGTWYVLVYGSSVLEPIEFTLRASSVPTFLTHQVMPRHGATTNASTTLSLSGTGFVNGTQVELVSNDGAHYAAESVLIDSFEQLSAVFDLTTVPMGSYDIRVLHPQGDSDQLPAAFTVFDYHAGTLSEDTTWSEHSRIIVDGTLTIPEGVTLTIDPGTIVKFAPLSGVDVSGGLRVHGSAANPVIFTSIHDDSLGGVVSGDGSKTAPEPGNWIGLRAFGSQDFKLSHFEVRYAAAAINGTQEALIHLANGVIRDSSLQGIYVWSPGVEVIGENLVVANNRQTGIFMRASSKGTFRNTTIVGNGFSSSGTRQAGVHIGAATMLFENAIVAFNRNGIDHSGSHESQTTLRNSLVYNPGGQNLIWTSGGPEPRLDENGNIVADPLFVDWEAGDYELGPGSPAIDAGRGVHAPPMDILDRPRYDDRGIPNVGHGFPAYVDIGAFERQTDTDAADLTVTQVSIVGAPIVSQGDLVTVQWYVENRGTVSAVGRWQDKVYLSDRPYVTPNAVMLDEAVEFSQPLDPGESYSGSVTAVVAGVSGPRYLVVVANADHGLEEAVRTNNAATAPVALAINVPTLATGSPVSATVAAGHWDYYRFEGEPVTTVLFELESASAGWELYVRHGFPPTTSEYDAVARNPLKARQLLRLPDPLEGTYYVGVLRGSRSETAQYTLSAELPPLSIRHVEPREIANASTATLTIAGDAFSSGSQVRLVGPDGTTFDAETWFHDSTRLFATFDLKTHGVPAGSYDVVVKQADHQAVTAVGAVTVVEDPTVSFDARLSLPNLMRPGRNVSVTIQYVNTGNVDIRNPRLRLKADSDEVAWSLPGDEQWIQGSTFDLLAFSSQGQPMVLRPGQTETISVDLQIPLRVDVWGPRHTLTVSLWRTGGEPGEPDDPTDQQKDVKQVPVVTSMTPEDKFGPVGYDQPGVIPGSEQRFIQPGQLMEYRIDFWNDEDAVVPTQDAVIFDWLDPEVFDVSTFEFTRVGFLDWDLPLPGGQAIDVRIDARPEMNFAVDVRAGWEMNVQRPDGQMVLDDPTGKLIWWFNTVDPMTGDYPEDPMAGFLPPFNPETQFELGWVEFRVKAWDDLPTATRIENQAFVQFDFLPNPKTGLEWGPAPPDGPWINTIDAQPPTSSVEALEPTTNSEEFLVRWSGSDDDGGSGIARYDVFVSSDGVSFQPWLSATSETEAWFSGTFGETYHFYSVAADHVGHREAKTPLAEAATTLVRDAIPVTIETLDASWLLRPGDDEAIFDLRNHVLISPPEETVSFELLSAPAFGTVALDGSLLRYTPPAEETGVTSIVYQVVAGAEPFVGTITITVARPLQNPLLAADVTGNGRIQAFDALLVINRLNRAGSLSVPVEPDAQGPPYLDVNGDGRITPVDALLVN